MKPNGAHQKTKTFLNFFWTKCSKAIECCWHSLLLISLILVSPFYGGRKDLRVCRSENENNEWKLQKKFSLPSIRGYNLVKSVVDWTISDGRYCTTKIKKREGDLRNHACYHHSAHESPLGLDFIL